MRKSTIRPDLFFCFLCIGLTPLFLFIYASVVNAQTVLTMPPTITSGPQKGSDGYPSKIRVVHKRQPKPAKPRKLLKGFSSTDAPEKYVPKVMFEVPKELTREYGVINQLWPIFLNRVHVDAQENVYLNFANAVVQFNRSGRVVKEIKHNIQGGLYPEGTCVNCGENGLLVDEAGNFCFYDVGVEGPFSGWIMDPKGNLIAHPNFKQTKQKRTGILGFEKGVIYSKERGDVFYKLPGVDEKNIGQVKTFPELVTRYHGKYGNYLKKDGREYQFPVGIDDGYQFYSLCGIDLSGAVYALYQQVQDPYYEPDTADEPAHPAWQPPPPIHMYKFDSECRLLAAFDFIPDSIDSNGDVYQWTGSEFIKWVKPSNLF